MGKFTLKGLVEEKLKQENTKENQEEKSGKNDMEVSFFREPVTVHMLGFI